jgi:hypothetical protein
VLVRYQRSEGRLSQISIEDRGSALGLELPLDTICIDDSYAQKRPLQNRANGPKLQLQLAPYAAAQLPEADIDTLLQHY